MSPCARILEAVRLIVVQNPAPFQVAHKHGLLHHEILRATHWGKLPQNRNVLGIKANGTEMKVLLDGKPCWTPKADGLQRMIANNLRVFSDPRVRTLFPAALNTPPRHFAQAVVMAAGDLRPPDPLALSTA